MEVHLSRQNEAVLFEARNAEAASTRIDGAPEIGGVSGGLRPMELLLAALASCSAFEVVTILKKQRQPLQQLDISARGERVPEGDVRPFQAITLTFRIQGEVALAKAERAAQLAVEKYCSVRNSLDPSITVDYQVEIQNP